MALMERVTVTMSGELIAEIDHVETNRSRFIVEAVQRELARRRRKGLLRSIKNPHLEARELADLGLTEWGQQMPGDDDDLVVRSAGHAVRWIEGKGWVEEKT